MRLFGHRYRLQLQDTLVTGGADGALDIRFDVETTTKSAPNNATITVNNLSQTTRRKLQELDGDGVYVRLEAGWVDGIWEIFRGDLRDVISHKEGDTWETVITSGDGEKTIGRSRVALSLGPGAGLTTVLRAIAESMGAVIEASTVSYIERIAFEGSGAADFGEGVALAGSSADALDDLLLGTGLEWSIQAGELRVLPAGAPIPGEVQVLSSDTGLVGSPEPGNKGITEVICLMRPGVEAGRQVKIESEQINGAHRIERCRYRGDTTGNDWHQLLDLKDWAAT